MALQKLFWEGSREPGKVPTLEFVISWWFLYRCFSLLQFASVTVYWNCSAYKDFAPQNMTSGRTRGLKKFSILLSLAIFYGPLLNYDIIDHCQTPGHLGGVSPPHFLPILTPSASQSSATLAAWRLEFGPSLFRLKLHHLVCRSMWSHFSSYYYGIWGSHQKSGLPYPPDRIFRLSRHQCACVASRRKWWPTSLDSTVFNGCRSDVLSLLC